MVRRGLVADRDEARGLIERGRVRVGGAPTDNPARLVSAEEALAVGPAPTAFVGRGAHKLDAALKRFGLDPTGWRALDAGASTGGFTDRLLQGGALRVIAVEVGRGQLHERLRQDDRVDSRERTDVRTLRVTDLDGPVDLLVGDLSFVSLRPLASHLVSLVRPHGHLVVLVKPQFEVERAEVDAGRGVVTDPALWRRSVVDVARALTDARAAIMGAMASPLRGADGNVEFLLHARVADPADEPGLTPGAAAELALADIDAASAPTEVDPT